MLLLKFGGRKVLSVTDIDMVARIIDIGLAFDGFGAEQAHLLELSEV